MKSTKIFFGFHTAVLNPTEKNLAKELLKNIVEISDWNHDMIFEVMRKTMQHHKVRMPVLYKVFTGEERGLPLPETLEILGKAKTLSLLEKISD